MGPTGAKEVLQGSESALCAPLGPWTLCTTASRAEASHEPVTWLACWGAELGGQGHPERPPSVRGNVTVTPGWLLLLHSLVTEAQHSDMAAQAGPVGLTPKCFRFMKMQTE